MFTGIIESLGIVKKIQKSSASAILGIESKKNIMDDMNLGDSVSVNGVCLTVVSFNKNYFEADVMFETINVTSLSSIQIGSYVNLERALKLSDRLGGHIVSGHVDGVGVIKSIQKNDIAYIFTIEAPLNILKYTIMRGSIAVDGASLTIMGLENNTFQVSVIPHTIQETVFSIRKEGDFVNLEVDIIAKYTERLIGSQSPTSSVLTESFLKENGF